MNNAFINLAYLVSAVLFVKGLKGLTHPRTAVRGNTYGSSGMLLAVLATLAGLVIAGEFRVEYIIAGIVLGGLIGGIVAVKIEMTSMPEMVALFNGFGGAASVLVAGAAIIEDVAKNAAMGMTPTYQTTVATVLSAMIGGITFWGSMIAFAKLKEIMSGAAILLPARHVINVILLVAALYFGFQIILDPANMTNYWILVGFASILGVTTTIPIGGADMPVVISLLNSYSGLAAAMTGFVIGNTNLIITGSLVGASGLILTAIMCKAMNRTLSHVLFGILEAGSSSQTDDEVYAGKVKSTSADEVAMMLDGAQRVVIVPGYGMAVSQAQHVVKDMAALLEAKGCLVEYAIHPVAGRMPGHMNVLLAEANVDYDKLIEMDAINPTMSQVDVCIVVGANDVVNPVAKTDPQSPIAGMPIIDVDLCRTVVVIKRSLSAGYAGIPNPLFAADNCLMFFGDGKKAFVDINTALKENE